MPDDIEIVAYQQGTAAGTEVRRRARIQPGAALAAFQMGCSRHEPSSLAFGETGTAAARVPIIIMRVPREL
jgi:hypothetical protein